MTDDDAVLAANRQAQRDLYGDTLEARVGALTRHFGVSQRKLAQTLGISAPMLSQLLSARRVKMGNTLAYERMVTLEDRAHEAVDPDSAQNVLDEVAASDVVATTQMRTSLSGEPGPAGRASLAGIDPDQLRAARDRLLADGVAPDLVALIDLTLG